MTTGIEVKTAKRKGPPPGHFNSLKTGARIERLTIGELPKSMHSIRVEGRVYRRGLEAVVREQHGGINTTQAHSIHTAATAVQVQGICRWLLRTKLDQMKPGEVLSCADALLRACERRDRALKELKLDREKRATLDEQLYGPRLIAADAQETAPAEDTPPAPNAPETPS